MKEYKKAIYYFTLAQTNDSLFIYNASFCYLALKNFKLVYKLYEKRLDINNLEQVELKSFFSSDCMCIDGLIKENKLYIVLLNPPLLKNNYV